MNNEEKMENKAPRVLTKRDKKGREKTYYYVKKYANFWLYEDENGLKVCFKADDLGLLKEYNVAELEKRVDEEDGKERYTTDKRFKKRNIDTYAHFLKRILK
jgi:hypothetical protein